MATLEQLLLRPDVRIITLCGPGGCGKTRLALHVAGICRQHYDNGAALILASAIDHREGLVSAIADALGFKLYGGADITLQLLTLLADQKLLLMIDNFEHLVPMAPLLAEIVQRSPDVTILVTSRERLQLRGEWVIDIQGLPAPQSDRDADLESYAAARLLLAEIGRVCPTHSLSPADRAAVGRICRLLEGLPLGLELAAAWAPVLALSDIASEIEQSLDFLSLAPQDTAERHRSLRAAFAHSWLLLQEDEREALRRLAIFPGSFDHRAAAQVTQVTLPMLARLVQKSLVRADSGSRYLLHEVVRAYALEHLQQVASVYEDLIHAHGIYYAQLVADQYARLDTPEHDMALRLVAIELEHVHAAWNRIADTPVSAPFVACLWRFYDAWGWFDEGIQQYARADIVTTALAGPALVRRMWFALHLGRYLEIDRLMPAAIIRLHHSSAHAELGFALVIRGFAAFHQGWYREAQWLFHEGRQLVQSQPYLATLATNGLGLVAQAIGSYDEARALLHEAARWSTVRRPDHAVTALAALAKIAFRYQALDTSPPGSNRYRFALLEEPGQATASLARLRRALAGQAPGASAILQVRVAVREGDVAQLLRFDLPITIRQTTALPLVPHYILFEDPEYNRQLASATASASRAFFVLSAQGESLLRQVRLATDRRAYNPHGLLSLRFDWSDNRTALGRLQLFKIDTANVASAFGPERIIEAGRLQQIELRELQASDQLNPGDSLELHLHVSFTGSNDQSIQERLVLRMAIVAEAVMPAPEAGYALLRHTQSGSESYVECERFAWGAAPDRIDMVCAEDLRREIVRRRALFRWNLSARPGRPISYALQKITPAGSTHIPALEQFEPVAEPAKTENST